jgi:hypothetical protein
MYRVPEVNSSKAVDPNVVTMELLIGLAVSPYTGSVPEVASVASE